MHSSRGLDEAKSLEHFWNLAKYGTDEAIMKSDMN